MRFELHHEERKWNSIYNNRWPLKCSLRSLPSLPIDQDVREDLRKTRADYRPEEEILSARVSLGCWGQKANPGGAHKSAPESQLLGLCPEGGAAEVWAGQEALMLACYTHRAGKALGKAAGELIPLVKMKGGGLQRGGVYQGHLLQGQRSTAAGQAGRKFVFSLERGVCWSEKEAEATG